MKKLECPFPSDCEYVLNSGRFIDEDRTLIRFFYRKIKEDDQEVKLHTYNLNCDPEDPRFNYFIEKCDDLDNVHLNTYRHLKNERINFEKLVMDIAKRDGLLFDLGLGDSKSYKNFLLELFKPYSSDDTENSNNLFAIKLDLFEIPHIRQSENSELKRNLRRAITPLEVVKAAIDIQLDNLENGYEIEVEDT